MAMLNNQRVFGHLGANVGAYFGAQPIGISRAGLEPWLGGVAGTVASGH